MSRRLVLLALIGALLALAPLAQASPPDQTWIGGFYDNADYDDIILLITGGVSTVESGMLWSLRPVSVVVSVLSPADSQTTALVPLPSDPSRAPPAA